MEYLIDLFGSLNVDIVEYIDIRLAIALIALGFCIKHFSVFKKFSNEYIPAILMFTSIVISVVLLEDYSANTIMNAFVNSLLTAAISIGIHQQGKGFLRSLKAASKSAVDTFVSEIEDGYTVDEDDD